MADDVHNSIKPVESMKNVTGLTPAKRREEKKRRPNPRREQKQESEPQSDESAGEQDHGDELVVDKGDQHSIDYCA
jgi:hypothetical protein